MPRASDDLTRIEGIGRAIADALVTAGIDTFSALANASMDEIKSALEKQGLRTSSVTSMWRDQAHLAAVGDLESLRDLRNRLTGGRPPDDYLTVIKGIGPKTSKALVDAGITSFTSLAESTEDHIREALAKTGQAAGVYMSSWPTQAGLASRSAWEELKAMQNQLDTTKPEGEAERRTRGDVVETSEPPQITGPEVHVRNTPYPPVFAIWPGSGEYFAIEVATRPQLFDGSRHGSERNADNFYGSWEETRLRKAADRNRTTYALPYHVWMHLRLADRLYYRVLTSVRSVDWVDVQTSLAEDDLDHAPSIELRGQFLSLPEVPYREEEDLWRAR